MQARYCYKFTVAVASPVAVGAMLGRTSLSLSLCCLPRGRGVRCLFSHCAPFCKFELGVGLVGGLLIPAPAPSAMTTLLSELPLLRPARLPRLKVDREGVAVVGWDAVGVEGPVPEDFSGVVGDEPCAPCA